MRRTLHIATLVLAVSAFGLLSAPAGSQSRGNGGQSEVQRGFDIAPVPVDMLGKNRALLGEGSYYVNGISDCHGCHGGIDGPNGYLGGGVDFGIAVSRNLTPDSSGYPAGLTLSQFIDVIREGRDWKEGPNADPLVVMPWPSYRYGTDRFIQAVYEYLRSIPCTPGGPFDPSGTRCG